MQICNELRKSSLSNSSVTSDEVQTMLKEAAVQNFIQSFNTRGATRIHLSRRILCISEEPIFMIFVVTTGPAQVNVKHCGQSKTRDSRDIFYGVWVSQSHRGRRSSSSSANLRTLSSRSMALPRRSFASSMRPVTLAQHASLKRINGSLGCHFRALKRTDSICSTFPACPTA